MDSTGPERRNRRRPSAKPYERPPSQRQSPLTSLWSIITAPFKKSSAPDPPVSESGSESGDESPQVASDRDVTQNARLNRLPKHVPSLAARNLSKRGHEMQASQSSTQLYPRIPSPFHFPQSGTSAASSSSAFPSAPAPIQPLAFDSTAAPETNHSRTPSSGIRFGPSRAETPDVEQRNSIYQPIVDFLQRKGDEKLNDFEVIGLTQTLKKTSHANAQDLVDILEASENVPSASFLQNLRSSSITPSSPTKRPFLAPPPVLNLPSSGTPPRRRNRRASYVGVGQNSPRIASPARRLSIRDTETSPDGSSSGKKRRLGDFGAPAHTNAAAGSSKISLNGSEEPSASKTSPPKELQSTVPFPASSPTPPVDKAGPVVSVHPSRFARHNAFKTQPPPIPSPLRNVASFQSQGSSPKLQPRKSDLSSRSQASAVILDILNDGSDAPPLPPQPTPELTNPFEKPSLIRPRVSVPTPRKVSKPLSRPGLSPAPLAPGSNSKRGFDSDHILDQIESTAPKRVKAETKPAASTQPETTTTGTSQPTVPSTSPRNPFGTPPPSTVTAFSLRTSAASSPSVFDSIPSKVSKPKPEIQSLLKSKPAQQTSALDPPQSTGSSSNGSSPSTMRAHAFGLGASTKPKPINKEPEIIVLDDDDDDMDVDTTKIASVQSSISLRPGHRRRQSIHRAEDIPIVVGDVDDTDVSPIRSRSPSPTKSVPHVRAKSVEEVEEEVDKSSKGSTNRGRSFGSRAGVTLSVSNGFGPGAAFKSTSPVVPSPLRHVSLPPSDSDDDDQANGENQKPAQDPTIERHPVLESPKTRARHLPPQNLRSFELVDSSRLTALGLWTPKDKDTLKARTRAATLPEDKLKVYHFIGAPPSSNPIVFIKPFDWSEAGFKPPVSNETWACGLCMCQSPESVEKCVVCGADRPSSMSNGEKPIPTPRTGASPPAALVNGFNWAASGMNPRASTGSWTCTSCMLQSPADAVKCIVCEAGRPDSPSSTLSGVQNSLPGAPPSQGGFDWASAGIKPPPSSSRDTWTCGDCSLQSPATAQKCIVCEAPRPL